MPRSSTPIHPLTRRAALQRYTKLQQQIAALVSAYPFVVEQYHDTHRHRPKPKRKRY